MSEALSILIPILALLLAALVIAGLWYWWSSGQPEDHASDVSQRSMPYENTAASAPTLSAAALKETAGRLFGAARSLIQARSGATPVRGAETVEVVRLLRDLADGSLVIEIEGRRYRNLDAISDPEIKRRFLGNAQALASFAGGETLSLPPAVPIPSGTTDERPLDQEQPMTSQAAAPPTEAAAKETGKAKPQPPSMVEEIENLLQQRLAASPEFRHRSVHIQSAPDGSIEVEIDGHYYDGVGDIPEEPVRNFIQDVIHEWEARK